MFLRDPEAAGKIKEKNVKQQMFRQRRKQKQLATLNNVSVCDHVRYFIIRIFYLWIFVVDIFPFQFSECFPKQRNIFATTTNISLKLSFLIN